MSTVVLGRRTSLAALLAVLGMLVAAPAYGSWPMARYDAKRQGTATGLSDLRFAGRVLAVISGRRHWRGPVPDDGRER